MQVPDAVQSLDLFKNLNSDLVYCWKREALVFALFHYVFEACSKLWENYTTSTIMFASTKIVKHIIARLWVLESYCSMNLDFLFVYLLPLVNFQYDILIQVFIVSCYVNVAVSSYCKQFDY